MPSYISILIIVFILWAYSFYYAYRAKDIKVECKNSSFSISLILFSIIGLMILFARNDLIGILCAIACVLAGIFYAQIPSGFSHEAIYLKGRKYLFKDVEEMELKSDDKYIYLMFKINKVFRILSDDIENKEKLERIYQDFQKGVIG